VPVAQVHSNIKKYLQDWDKNINLWYARQKRLSGKTIRSFSVK
jgi:hypothetical protein